MNSVHFGLIGAVIGVLKMDPPIAEGRVYRSRSRAIGKDSTTAVVVRAGRASSMRAEMVGGRTTWKTLINIECYGRGTSDAPDAAADEIVVAVFDRLAAATDLGGLAQDLEPFEGETLGWDFDDVDTSMACITANFVITHQTNGATLK